MKADEQQLLIAITLTPRRFVRDLVKDIDMCCKRAEYVFRKWVRNGWYECGVSLDLGWLTSAGLDEARRQLEAIEDWRNLDLLDRMRVVDRQGWLRR